MIGYTTVGTNDLERAGKFYDALLGELGAGRAMEMERIILWANKPASPMFGVITPLDENPSSCGNGSMVALSMESTEAVATMYAKAMELGATDEGEPGPRGDGGAYFAYVRDLDGNKLAFYCM